MVVWVEGSNAAYHSQQKCNSCFMHRRLLAFTAFFLSTRQNRARKPLSLCVCLVSAAALLFVQDLYVHQNCIHLFATTLGLLCSPNHSVTVLAPSTNPGRLREALDRHSNLVVRPNNPSLDKLLHAPRKPLHRKS